MVEPSVVTKTREESWTYHSGFAIPLYVDGSSIISRQEFFFAYPCRIKLLTSAMFHPSIPNKIDSNVFSFTIFGCWSESVQQGGAQLTTTRFCVRHSVSSYNSGGSASPPLHRVDSVDAYTNVTSLAWQEAEQFYILILGTTNMPEWVHKYHIQTPE